uniref:Proline and serine rich 3 n=1 Tax=Salvator merianae TaxID=96440 RepID=A0A8D0B5T0_SALMN
MQSRLCLSKAEHLDRVAMGFKNESCLAVFSNLGSPFLETSSLRSHYHPSQMQPPKQEQQYAVLSPSRLRHKACLSSPKQAVMQSPPCSSCLPDSASCEVESPKLGSTSPFNESWPSTECSSSLTPEETKSLPSKQGVGPEASLKPQNSVSESESVIARYIERFRHGQPTNRKERWTPGGESDQFWWLGHSLSPACNVSKKETSPSSVSNRSEATSSLSVFVDGSPSGESQDNSTLDPEILSLQDRATRLLQRSMFPLSSSGHISSEETTSTPISTTTAANVGVAGHSPHHLTAQQSQGVASDVTRKSQFSKPEDDILFQWRLRRKMEEASKSIAFMPPLAWRSPCIHVPCAAPCLVVAEKLFSPSASSSPHKEKTSKSLKNWDTQEALRDPVAVPSHPQLLDMAAQLLEQAEDSDGTEFEDDPLLEVLRNQRELLRSKLRAVEIQMAELEGCH